MSKIQINGMSLEFDPSEIEISVNGDSVKIKSLTKKAKDIVKVVTVEKPVPQPTVKPTIWPNYEPILYPKGKIESQPNYPWGVSYIK